MQNKYIPNIEESLVRFLLQIFDASLVAVTMEMMSGYKMSSYRVCYLAGSKDTRHRLMYLDR